MSLHEKNTSVYLSPHVRAKAEDEAKRNGQKLSPFLSRLIDEALDWGFLTNANLEFITAISIELGDPWDTRLVLNRLVAYVREEMLARRLVLGGFLLQAPNGKKSSVRNGDSARGKDE